MDSADIFILLYVAAMVKTEGGSSLGVGCDSVGGEKINIKWYNYMLI